MASVASGEVKAPLVAELEAIVGPAAVLWDSYDLALYEYDGSIDRHRPEAVVLPNTAEQVSAIVKLCNRRASPTRPEGLEPGFPVAPSRLVAAC